MIFYFIIVNLKQNWKMCKTILRLMHVSVRHARTPNSEHKPSLFNWSSCYQSYQMSVQVIDITISLILVTKSEAYEHLDKLQILINGMRLAWGWHCVESADRLLF